VQGDGEAGVPAAVFGGAGGDGVNENWLGSHTGDFGMVVSQAGASGKLLPDLF